MRNNLYDLSYYIDTAWFYKKKTFQYSNKKEAIKKAKELSKCEDVRTITLYDKSGTLIYSITKT